MKLCKDCKWGVSEDGPVSSLPSYLQCRAPKNQILVNLVTGYSDHKISYCSVQRTEGRLFAYLLGICGKSGRWWEAKE